jgi:hypothetical protein
MRTLIAALVVIALATPDAWAQRGGGLGGVGSGRGGMGGMGRGGRGGRDGGMGRGADNLQLPSAGDLKKFNPGALIVDKRKKLELVDAQVKTIEAVRDRFNEKTAPILARYDSLRKEFRLPRAGRRDPNAEPDAVTDSARVAAMGQLRIIRANLDSITARRSAAIIEILDFLTEPKQHAGAAELLNEQDTGFEEKMPRALMEGRGDRRGRGEGRGNPPAPAARS